MSYAVDLRTDVGLVHRSAPNAYDKKDAKAAGALIALAEGLAEPASFLPERAWLVAPKMAGPYVASNYLLEVTTQPYGGDREAPDAPRDLADVAWPLGGRLVDWGTEYDVDLGDPAATYRCGTLDLEAAAKVSGALGPDWSSEQLPESDWMMASLLWPERVAMVDLALSNLLPDDPVACPAAQ